jgi:GT2 family glycosyltransferase
VADLDLEIGATLPDVEESTAFHSLFGVVRLHGVPIGYLQAPLVGGRCSGRALTARVLRAHEDVIYRHLLVDALVDGSFSSRKAPTDLLAVRHVQPDRTPSFTVAVCTRDRTADLMRCLASLAALDYPGLDLLVVDNAPATTDTKRQMSSAFPAVRYVCEPLPGLSRARNRAIREAQTEILAYVDDDVVVDRGWARAIAAVMGDHADVMAVTGLVAPYELDTRAQLDFERHFGWERRFDRRWFRRRDGEAMGERLANTGKVGTGANMAFRRHVFREIGEFDLSLGAGTLARGGEDLDMFFRVLKAGHSVVYEPAALTRHRHRRDHAALQQQVGGWASGMTAYVVRSMRQNSRERRPLLAFLSRLLCVYYPRRAAQSLVSRALRPSLTMAEWVGALAGLARYRPVDRQVHNADIAPHVRPLRPLRHVQLDLAEPLQPVLPGPDDSDRVRVDVSRGGRPVGTVDIWCGGRPVTRVRIADAIASELSVHLLQPREELGRLLRERCGVA